MAKQQENCSDSIGLAQGLLKSEADDAGRQPQAKGHREDVRDRCAQAAQRDHLRRVQGDNEATPAMEVRSDVCATEHLFP